MTIPFSLNVGSGLILLVLMDLGYSNRCTGVYHHCFNLYFTDNICCGTSSHMFATYISSLVRLVLGLLIHFI